MHIRYLQRNEALCGALAQSMTTVLESVTCSACLHGRIRALMITVQDIREAIDNAPPKLRSVARRAK